MVALTHSFWNQSIVLCSILTVASRPACRFLRRQVRWPGVPISWIFHTVYVIHTVTGFRIISEAEVDGFLGCPCFLYDPTDVGNLISGSSAFSKSSFYVWRFSVHVLLKPSLKDFEQSQTYIIVYLSNIHCSMSMYKNMNWIHMSGMCKYEFTLKIYIWVHEYTTWL